jgi:hypothetical protein
MFIVVITKNCEKLCDGEGHQVRFGAVECDVSL